MQSSRASIERAPPFLRRRPQHRHSGRGACVRRYARSRSGGERREGARRGKATFIGASSVVVSLFALDFSAPASHRSAADASLSTAAVGAAVCACVRLAKGTEARKEGKRRTTCLALSSFSFALLSFPLLSFIFSSLSLSLRLITCFMLTLRLATSTARVREMRRPPLPPTLARLVFHLLADHRFSIPALRKRGLSSTRCALRLAHCAGARRQGPLQRERKGEHGL